MKTWGFNKKNKIKYFNIFKIWKASIFIILFSIGLSFFSIVNDVVHANKTEIINKINNFSKLSFLSKNNIPNQIAELIINYKKGKNILNDKYKKIYIFAENNIGKAISILGYSSVKKKILQIFNQLKIYREDIFKLLGKDGEKTYLIILENTSEERPDSGFFGSFMKVKINGGHIKSFDVIDSYKIIFDQCGIKGKNWYKDCNRDKLHIKHNLKDYNELFTYTSFLNSNYFGFTKLNAKNIIAHYKKAYNKQLDGVIFIKSNILKYIILDGEKIVRKMEMMNYKNLIKKRKGLLNKGIKAEYLSYVKHLILSNKQNIIKNFIKNYDKIKDLGLIRLYLPKVSNSFKQFLKDNNFIYYNDDKSAYLFFYNVGNNKCSKFVDHIITINNKVFVNPQKIPLQKGKNILSYKNIFNEEVEYYKILEEEKVDKESFLRRKDTEHYDTLLIVPKDCKKYKVSNKKYIIDCK